MHVIVKCIVYRFLESFVVYSFQKNDIRDNSLSEKALWVLLLAEFFVNVGNILGPKYVN